MLEHTSRISIEWIKERVGNDEYLITNHAETERRNDSLSVSQLEQALLDGEILEEYPEDKRGFSCLVCGEVDNRPVHVVCGRNSEDWLVVITVYIPMLPKWKSPWERNH